MRVLFITANEGSMLHPMVSLAWALRGSGHDVLVATQPFATNEVTETGLTAVALGRQGGADRLLVAMRVTPEMLEDARPGLHSPFDVVSDPDGVSWDDLLAGYTEEVERGKYENFPMIAGLVRLARSWQPDLVVWEPFSPAGAIAAKACGAAHARMLFGADVFGVARERFLRLRAEHAPDTVGTASTDADPLAAWLASYGRKYGFEFTEDMTTGQFTIDQFPRSLQTEADLTYLHTQFVPYGGLAVVPDWLREPPSRPRVALTMGLTAGGFFAGYTFDLREVLDRLAELDVEVVATVEESQQERLSTVPDNVRLVTWAPLDVLAATCSAAINHAGFGTLSTFARHGVPQLTLPYHFDEPLLARRLAETGAALELPPSEANGDSVRDGVHRLLTEPAFSEGAARLRDEILALPTPNQAVGTIEDLTTKYRADAR